MHFLCNYIDTDALDPSNFNYMYIMNIYCRTLFFFISPLVSSWFQNVQNFIVRVIRVVCYYLVRGSIVGQGFQIPPSPM